MTGISALLQTQRAESVQPGMAGEGDGRGHETSL